MDVCPIMSADDAPRKLSFSLQNPRWQFLFAAITGVMLVLCFAPFGFSLLAWFALIPLLTILRQKISWRRAFSLGWVSGTIFFYFATNWITHSMTKYGQMAFVLAHAVAWLFAAILALFPALFALITSQLMRVFSWPAVALAPFVWVMSEWLRALVTGVTWNALGISQVNIRLLNAAAQFGGAYLLSLLIVSGSSLILLLSGSFRKEASPHSRLFVALALLPAALLLLSVMPHSVVLEAPAINVAVVQPNIPLTLYDDSSRVEKVFANNLRLAREAIAQSVTRNADLIVWAESPLLVNYEEDEKIRTQLDALAKEFNAHVIFNAVARQGENYFNSVQTIAPPSGNQPAQALNRYDKIRLVPFGEYVPWRSVLGRFVPAITGDFTPGSEAIVNNLRLRTQLAVVSNQETEGEMGIERTTRFARVGTFICYEAAYPNLVRRFVQNGATVLVNVSNDAWFGNSAGARQHLAHARLRAIENNRDLIRVTNTGISALISSDGQVSRELPQFIAASQVWTAKTNNPLTFYTRHGDWVAVVSAIVTAIALIAALTRIKPPAVK
jgi:apolipoprotein N-acyltransferase